MPRACMMATWILVCPYYNCRRKIRDTVEAAGGRKRKRDDDASTGTSVRLKRQRLFSASAGCRPDSCTDTGPRYSQSLIDTDRHRVIAADEEPNRVRKKRGVFHGVDYLARHLRTQHGLRMSVASSSTPPRPHPLTDPSPSPPPLSHPRHRRCLFADCAMVCDSNRDPVRHLLTWHSHNLVSLSTRPFDEWFACRVCNLVFGRETSLIKHVWIKHVYRLEHKHTGREMEMILGGAPPCGVSVDPVSAMLSAVSASWNLDSAPLPPALCPPPSPPWDLAGPTAAAAAAGLPHRRRCPRPRCHWPAPRYPLLRCRRPYTPRYCNIAETPRTAVPI